MQEPSKEHIMPNHSTQKDRPSLFAFSIASLTAGCLSVAQSPANDASSAAQQSTADYGPFRLKKEWDGPCARSEMIDVNLGHAPEAFVRAAHCQIHGREPAADLVQHWAGELRKNPRVRRIDTVMALCATSGRKCEFQYSDPWESQPELLDPPKKTTKRDIGAVFMYFFNCPGPTNCGMEWANTHAVGMKQEHPLLGFGEQKAGYYVPTHAGFWQRELLDAKYAGIDFLLLNTYGPDIENGKLKPLADALKSVKDPVKIAFFDDTWSWGQPYFSKFWTQKPDLNDPEAAAELIYTGKWQPFFRQIDKAHWYRFKGRPFMYFYNSGTVEPRSKSAALIEKLKARFKAEFGEDPFIVADSAYFDDARLPKVADSKYQWFTFNNPMRRSRETMNNHVVDHAMVKWDAVGRDRPGDVSKPSDLIVKDEKLLKRVLRESKDAEVLVLATWNDLGEGTGINRNYDYYLNGRWARPDHFMRFVRASQAGEDLP
jgi:hypothetical protein